MIKPLVPLRKWAISYVGAMNQPQTLVSLKCAVIIQNSTPLKYPGIKRVNLVIVIYAIPKQHFTKAKNTKWKKKLRNVKSKFPP